MNKFIIYKSWKTFDANPKKLHLAYNLLNMNTQPTTNPCLKVVEHSAEQSAAIKLPQQGIVYQKV